ncbi:MAG: flavodoxin family protein [Deltaproteobacteria bacterium]|nr:flavodoxin family protein [Deltaproteobacteria bacterium]
MKVLGIVCSPRMGGNTEILMKEALQAAQEAGAEIRLFPLADKKIMPCDACGACEETGICIVEDDMQELYNALEDADGIIFGTPVYFLNVTAQAKAVIDRTYAFLRTRKLRGKVAAALVVARRIGAGQVLSLLYTFFTVQRMIIAGGAVGYGREKGEVVHGTGGSPVFSAMEEARALGKSLTRMVSKMKPSID